MKSLRDQMIGPHLWYLGPRGPSDEFATQWFAEPATPRRQSVLAQFFRLQYPPPDMPRFSPTPSPIRALGGPFHRVVPMNRLDIHPEAFSPRGAP